jgi:hypothetical protein
MGVILFTISIFYCIYLNLKLREVQEEVYESSIDLDALEIKVYNKMMDIRREMKESIKPKRIEKSRRRSTKRSRKLPKA